MNTPAYNRNLAFIAACACIFIFGIAIITLGSTLPQLSVEYDLAEIDKGTLGSLLPFGILAGSLIFGPVVDKYSYKYLLAVSVFLTITGFEIIALASVFYQLGIAFFLIGFGGGMINGATSAMVADISEDYKENKSANLSMLGVFFGLGSLGMPVLLNILSRWLDYRHIISGTGVFLILPLVLILVISYPAPKQAQSMSLSGITKLLRNAGLLLFGFVLFFQSGWEALVNNWTTTYLIDNLKFQESAALSMLTLFVFIFTIGRLSLGFILKTVSGKKAIIISTLIALCGSVIMMLAVNKLMVIAAICMLGIGLAAGFPVMLGYVGDKFSAWSGTAFSIAFSIALIGNIFINYFTGLTTESIGISGFPVIPVIVGSSSIILLLIALRNES